MAPEPQQQQQASAQTDDAVGEPGRRDGGGGRPWHAVSIVAVAAIVILVVGAIREPAVTRHRAHDHLPLDVAASDVTLPPLNGGDGTAAPLDPAHGPPFSTDATVGVAASPTTAAMTLTTAASTAKESAPPPPERDTEPNRPTAAAAKESRRRVVELGNMTLRFPPLEWIGGSTSQNRPLCVDDDDGGAMTQPGRRGKRSAPSEPRRSRKHKPYDIVVPDLCVRPVGALTHRSATNHNGVRVHLATEVMSEKFTIPSEMAKADRRSPPPCVREGSVAVQLTNFGECNVYHALYRVMHFASMIVRMSRIHNDRHGGATANASSALFSAVLLMDKQRDKPYDVGGCSAMRRLLVEILQGLLEVALPDPATRPQQYLASVGYGAADGNASAMANALGVDAIASGALERHVPAPPTVGAPPVCFDYGVIGMDSASFKSQRPPLVREVMAPALKRILRQQSSAGDGAAAQRHTDVVLVSRITRRRFLNEPEVVAEFEKAIERANAVLSDASAAPVVAGNHTASSAALPLRSRVLFFENMTVGEQVAACAGARALIGLQGAALTWGYTMPDGASIMEVNVPMHSDAATPGLNANPFSTFGHVASLAKINHVALRIPSRFAVMPPGGRGWGAADIEVPAAPFGCAVLCAVVAGVLPAKHAVVASACDASKWPTAV